MIAQFDTYYLCSIQEKDARNVCNLMVTNQEQFNTYLPRTVAQNSTPTLSKLFCSKKEQQFKNNQEYLFTIKENKSNTLIGLVYLKAVDWKLKQGEFAYCIDYKAAGKNIISRAIQILSKYAFETLKLETLQILVHKSNIASTKVALKNNFIWKKTLKNEYISPNNIPLNMELYELYKT